MIGQGKQTDAKHIKQRSPVSKMPAKALEKMSKSCRTGFQILRVEAPACLADITCSATAVIRSRVVVKCYCFYYASYYLLLVVRGTIPERGRYSG